MIYMLSNIWSNMKVRVAVLYFLRDDSAAVSRCSPMATVYSKTLTYSLVSEGQTLS